MNMMSGLRTAKQSLQPQVNPNPQPTNGWNNGYWMNRKRQTPTIPTPIFQSYTRYR